MFEQYLTNPTALWIIFFATAAASGFVLDGLVRLVWKFRDLGRAWVVTVPTTRGSLAQIERVRLDRGERESRAPGGDERELRIMRGEAAYPTRRGPLHLMDEHGNNLVAPSKEEAIAAGETASLQAQAEAGQLLLEKAEKAAAKKAPLPASEEELKAAAEAVARYKRFRIWDPLTYWRAARENDMEDLYAAQREKDHWAVKLAPLFIVLFIGLLGFMLFALWKIMPLLSKAGGT